MFQSDTKAPQNEPPTYGGSHGQEKQHFVTQDQSFVQPTLGEATSRSGRSSRICGLKRRTFFVVFAIATLVVIGLAAGLGGGLAAAKSSDKDNEPSASSPARTSPTVTSSTTPSPTASVVLTSDNATGGILDPTYYSKRGVWNGSDIAIENGTLAYQHHTGEIRWARYDNRTRSWFSPEPKLKITDAKNGSRINLIWMETGEWHLFYIDKDNQLRQKWTDVSSIGVKPSSWQNGSLDDSNLHIWNAERAAMKVSQPDSGLTLMFAKDNQTFSLWSYQKTTSQWSSQKDFDNANTRAGMTLSSSGDTALFWTFLNANGSIECWNYDPSQGTSWIPINFGWNIPIPEFHPLTWLEWSGGMLFAQDKDGIVTGYPAGSTGVTQTAWNFERSIALGIYPAILGTYICSDVYSTATEIWFQAKGQGDSFEVITSDENGDYSTTSQRTVNPPEY